MSLKITISEEDRKAIQKRIKFLSQAISGVVYLTNDPFDAKIEGKGLSELAEERRHWGFVMSASRKIKSPSLPDCDTISQMEKNDEEKLPS